MSWSTSGTLRAPGQRTAAREPLEALELAAHCGARTLERRARGELAAIGVRPRTTERAGAGSLTPSELRVVEIAAAGSTNREIAQTLFVTEKTVEPTSHERSASSTSPPGGGSPTC